MKKGILSGVFSLLLAAAAAAFMPGTVVVEAELLSSEPAACLATETSDLSLPVGNEPDILRITTSYYPPCSAIHGSYCGDPDTTAWCQWAPGEPEICVCQENHTYRCP